MRHLINLFLIIIASVSYVAAQSIASAPWTAWMNIKQPGCIQRARVSFKLANIPVTQDTAWYVVGSKDRLNVRIKCVADDGSTRLVNSNATRVLVDVEVEGLASDFQASLKLRDCIKEFMKTGQSTCWQTGSSPNAPTGNFKTISWNESLASMNIFGYTGQQYTYYCPPNGPLGTVWGTNYYTDNSSICTAAVHASRINRGRGGNVRVQFSGGKTSFTGKRLSGITSLNYTGQMRSFVFLNPPNGVNAPVITVFGRKWNETESGWNGVWTRQEYTNIFHAVWTRGGRTVKAVLTLQINANKVTIDRRDVGSNARCEYTGLLSYDRKSVKGAYKCWNAAGALVFPNGTWQATIER